MPTTFELPAHLTVGAAATFQGVTAIPLFAPPPRRPLSYLLTTEALAERKLELSELGNVARLHARNTSRRPVLILEGDHLLGARQNRAVVATALLGGHSAVELPVACVERGRWSGPSDRFDATATMAPAGVRRIVKASVTHAVLQPSASGAAQVTHAADQDAIWRQIAEQQRRLRVASATSSLAHSFAARAQDVASISAALPWPRAARGLALALGDELVSVDLFDQERTCQHYWSQLVEGAALEALGQRGSGRGAAGAVERVRAVLDQLAHAPWHAVPAVSEGQERRVELADLTASALLASGQLLHLGVASAVVRSRPKPVRQDLPASLAERYRIVERIGVGGVKEVFRATELATGKDVAIARIPDADHDELAREAELARKIEGGHTALIHEAFVDEYQDGYLVMEYCAGPSLAQLAGGGLPVEVAGPILLAFARALTAIHAAAVLHRDIKLENVLLCHTERGPQLKVIDFGVSAQARNVSTAVGEMPFRGTFPYMGHEVLTGQRLDARADVFAFGVCCYRLLTGEFPLPPHEHEAAFDYLYRLRAVERHDVSRLPRLPTAVAAMIARMLEMRPAQRPFMPEVLPAFERAFGELPLRMPGQSPAASMATHAGAVGGAPPARPGTAPPTELLPVLWRVPVAVAPEQVLVAPCPLAPLVTLEPSGDATTIRAFADDGRERWRIHVPGRLLAGVRADLDGDGLRELYLAGPEHVALLTARGELRYSRLRTDVSERRESSALFPREPAPPTLLALADPARPRLVLDGRMLEPHTGRDLGRMPMAFEGDGRQLVEAAELTGLSYNGHALQAFRGARGTGAAIVHPPGATRFTVAQVETVGPRVQLAVYGPGGKRLHILPISSCEVTTGDRAAISQLSAHALVSAAHAPLAVLGEGGAAVVITPLLGTPAWLPPTLSAFLLPAGRELWRTRLSASSARALLADLDGDGKPELLLGTGDHLHVYEPWSGATTMPLPCRGLPVAFGDPFGAGVACLVTASSEGLEVRRGPACQPHQMQWAGPRGDLWRTGTVTRDGTALGPI